MECPRGRGRRITPQLCCKAINRMRTRSVRYLTGLVCSSARYTANMSGQTNCCSRATRLHSINQVRHSLQRAKTQQSLEAGRLLDLLVKSECWLDNATGDIKTTSGRKYGTVLIL